MRKYWISDVVHYEMLYALWNGSQWLSFIWNEVGVLPGIVRFYYYRYYIIYSFCYFILGSKSTYSKSHKGFVVYLHKYKMYYDNYPSNIRWHINTYQ